MFNVGKKRTLYGEFLDKNKVLQERVREVTRLNKDTVTRACNDMDYKPKRSVEKLLVDAAEELTGIEVEAKDFWPNK